MQACQDTKNNLPNAFTDSRPHNHSDCFIRTVCDFISEYPHITFVHMREATFTLSLHSTLHQNYILRHVVAFGEEIELGFDEFGDRTRQRAKQRRR